MDKWAYTESLLASSHGFSAEQKAIILAVLRALFADEQSGEPAHAEENKENGV